MEWFVKCLRNYAVFEGRARRKEFWMYQLYYVLLLIALTVIASIAGIADKDGNSWLTTVLELALFLPGLAVSIRRMHEVHHSGWWVLLPLWNIVLFCRAGDVGDNQYGTDPKHGQFE
jgi:uncharacterized membrane protein YhaH (DUF805 family)